MASTLTNTCRYMVLDMPHYCKKEFLIRWKWGVCHWQGYSPHRWSTCSFVSSRTILTKDGTKHDTNISHCSGTREKDESIVNVKCGMTTEDHTPMLSVCGMRSRWVCLNLDTDESKFTLNSWKVLTMSLLYSVKDMLTWAKSVLETEKVQRETAEGQPPSYPTSNPLRNINTTRGKAYWTRPNHDKFKNEIWYCLGWLRVVMPTSGLSCLGSNLRPRDDPISEKWIIGAESPQVEVILHNGAALGSTCAFYTFPETQSGIIVFSNAMQSKDSRADTISYWLAG
jgi:hypothetical protein